MAKTEWIEWRFDGPADPKLRKLYKEGKLPLVGARIPSGKGESIDWDASPKVSPEAKEKTPPSPPEKAKSTERATFKLYQLKRYVESQGE